MVSFHATTISLATSTNSHCAAPAVSRKLTEMLTLKPNDLQRHVGCVAKIFKRGPQKTSQNLSRRKIFLSSIFTRYSLVRVNVAEGNFSNTLYPTSEVQLKFFR